MAVDPSPLEDSPARRGAFLLSRRPAPRYRPLIYSQHRLDNPVQLRGHCQRAAIAQVLPALFVYPPLDVHAECFPHLRQGAINTHRAGFRILRKNLEPVVPRESAHLRQVCRIGAKQFGRFLTAHLRQRTGEQLLADVSGSFGSANHNSGTDPLVRLGTPPASATRVAGLAAGYREPL